MNPKPGEITFHLLQSDDLQVCIANYGARLVFVKHHNRDLLYGPKTTEGILTDECYCGAVCGRVANRIARGRFSLHGVTHQLAINNGNNHLHGGIAGFSHRTWSFLEADVSHLLLAYKSPDGEENYPGNLEVTATYRLAGSALTLLMQAQSDAPTIVNLTNHAYWNLAGEGSIDSHTLEVRASAYTPVDAENIPTGSVIPVQGTDFDLRTPVLLGERNSPAHPAAASGYDHNFVLPAAHKIQAAAVLSCPAAGRKLTVLTDAPGIQVYTGEYLPHRRGGVALEAQGFPNAVNVPHFPSVILNPGEIFRRSISWVIS